MNKLFSLRNPDIEMTNQKLRIGIDFWANSLLSQSMYIDENMTEFFRFKKHENKEVMDLLRQRLKNISDATKRINQIDEKKKSLFESK